MDHIFCSHIDNEILQGLTLCKVILILFTYSAFENCKDRVRNELYTEYSNVIYLPLELEHCWLDDRKCGRKKISLLRSHL